MYHGRLGSPTAAVWWYCRDSLSPGRWNTHLCFADSCWERCFRVGRMNVDGEMSCQETKVDSQVIEVGRDSEVAL